MPFGSGAGYAQWKDMRLKTRAQELDENRAMASLYLDIMRFEEAKRQWEADQKIQEAKLLMDQAEEQRRAELHPIEMELKQAQLEYRKGQYGKLSGKLQGLLSRGGGGGGGRGGGVAGVTGQPGNIGDSLYGTERLLSVPGAAEILGEDGGMSAMNTAGPVQSAKDYATWTEQERAAAAEQIPGAIGPRGGKAKAEKFQKEHEERSGRISKMLGQDAPDDPWVAAEILQDLRQKKEQVFQHVVESEAQKGNVSIVNGQRVYTKDGEKNVREAMSDFARQATSKKKIRDKLGKMTKEQANKVIEGLENPNW